MRRYPRGIFKIMRRQGRYPGVRQQRFFGSSRRAKSRRIFRKFIRRTALKPELKWVNVFNNGQIGLSTGSSGASGTFNLTPLLIGQGTGIGSRLGDQIKFVKVDLRIRFTDASGRLVATAPQVPNYLFRMIVWTPRTDFGQATTYMNALATVSNIDFNNVTVLKDITFSLAPDYVQEATTADSNHGAVSDKIFTFKIPHPRNVHFVSNTINDIDAEKYGLFMTLIGSNITGTGTFYSFDSKVWYFDS